MAEESPHLQVKTEYVEALGAFCYPDFSPSTKNSSLFVIVSTWTPSRHKTWNTKIHTSTDTLTYPYIHICTRNEQTCRHVKAYVLTYTHLQLIIGSSDVWTCTIQGPLAIFVHMYTYMYLHWNGRTNMQTNTHTETRKYRNAPNYTHTHTHIYANTLLILIHTHTQSLTKLQTYLPSHQSAYAPTTCPCTQMHKHLCINGNRNDHELISILIQTCAQIGNNTHTDIRTLPHLSSNRYTPIVAHSPAHSYPRSSAFSHV